MKIDPNPRKTKTKQYRTDEEYLQMLSDRHPVVGLILEYRGLRKLLSTYVEALPQLINPQYRTHPHLVQPSRHRNRAAQFDEPEPAKHPGARRTGPRDPQGVRTVGRRTPAALGRLFAGRTAADGALERRRGHDRRPSRTMPISTRRPPRESVRRRSGRRNARTAAAGQNGQLRHHLRHLRFRARPTAATFRAPKRKRSSTDISPPSRASKNTWRTW